MNILASLAMLIVVPVVEVVFEPELTTIKKVASEKIKKALGR